MTEIRALPRALVAVTLGGALLLAVAACVRQGRPLDPGPYSFWLASNGFDARAGWPSTVVHLGRDEMGGATRISYVLDEVGEVALLPARDEGWGVFLRDEAGEVGCELDVWLNGSLRRRVPTSGLRGVDQLIRARSLSGLEIHAGAEGPVQDPEGCGALLLWSEEMAEAWDPPFRGWVVGAVRGNAADTVVAVRLEPDGQRIRPDRDGRYELAGVTPGVYQVVFMTASGALLRRVARVYAFAETRVDAQLSREDR